MGVWIINYLALRLYFDWIICLTLNRISVSSVLIKVCTKQTSLLLSLPSLSAVPSFMSPFPQLAGIYLSAIHPLFKHGSLLPRKGWLLVPCTWLNVSHLNGLHKFGIKLLSLIKKKKIDLRPLEEKDISVFWKPELLFGSSKRETSKLGPMGQICLITCFCKYIFF